MPDIFVMRGEGNSRGPDIVDPLLTTVEACTARGRNELDEQASGLQEVEITIPFRSGLRLGNISQVTDVVSGLVWYGKIVGLSYQYGATDCEVSILFHRPSVSSV